jgi:hypothetical protein
MILDERRLQMIAEILEAVDRRCAAADGPVTQTKEEITAEELRKIYRLAVGKRP